jgi:hypothetical protein
MSLTDAKSQWAQKGKPDATYLVISCANMVGAPCEAQHRI